MQQVGSYNLALPLPCLINNVDRIITIVSKSKEGYGRTCFKIQIHHLTCNDSCTAATPIIPLLWVYRNVGKVWANKNKHLNLCLWNG